MLPTVLYVHVPRYTTMPRKAGGYVSSGIGMEWQVESMLPCMYYLVSASDTVAA